MTNAENIIISSKGKSIITLNKDGHIANTAINAARPNRTTEFEKKNGVYTFDMWLKKQANNYIPPGAEWQNS